MTTRHQLPIGTRVTILTFPYWDMAGTVASPPDENGWIDVDLDDYPGHPRWFYRYELLELAQEEAA